MTTAVVFVCAFVLSSIGMFVGRFDARSWRGFAGIQLIYLAGVVMGKFLP